MGRLLSLLIALAATFTALPAAAGGCAPRNEVIGLLAGQFGETRHALGLTDHGEVLEVWGNPATGSWTVTVTTPDGITCLGAQGGAFQIRSDPPGEGDDA